MQLMRFAVGDHFPTGEMTLLHWPIGRPKMDCGMVEQPYEAEGGMRFGAPANQTNHIQRIVGNVEIH